MNTALPVDPFSQSTYQVRFDWGTPGIDAVGTDAHIIVLVDGLGVASNAVLAAEDGAEAVAVDAALAARLASIDAVVLAGSLRNRSAVAKRVLEIQEERQGRTMVSIIAGGGTWADGSARFTVEDHLAAGAIIDALVELGIDHTSPEAAVACAAFGGLKNASTHLVSASGSARALAASGDRDRVKSAAKRDATDLVPELRDGVFDTV